MIAFIIGAMIGFISGVTFMCVLSVANGEEAEA